MNIILFGPQGSGKGTQARLLCDKFGFSYFESGAYLRKLSDTHEEMKLIMNSGKLVPDEEFTSYLTAYLDQENLYDDIIFDGFPRTLEQYKFLKVWLNQKQVKINLAIVLEINEEETLKRLGARRLDPKTGKIYNLVSDLPPSDVDINTLVQRDDDKPEAIKKRLALYHERTETLIEGIKKDTNVFRVNGERSIEDIHNDLVGIVEEAKKYEQI
jgi:adenylate kinase